MSLFSSPFAEQKKEKSMSNKERVYLNCPYSEKDTPNPLHYYAESKLAFESNEDEWFPTMDGEPVKNVNDRKNWFKKKLL